MEQLKRTTDIVKSILEHDEHARNSDGYLYLKVLNICGDDALSKYDVGLMIADKLGVSRDLIRAISVGGSSGIFERVVALFHALLIIIKKHGARDGKND